MIWSPVWAGQHPLTPSFFPLYGTSRHFLACSTGVFAGSLASFGRNALATAKFRGKSCHFANVESVRFVRLVILTSFFFLFLIFLARVFALCHRIHKRPGWRLSGFGCMIVGGEVQVPYDILTFKLHIHGPSIEVGFGLSWPTMVCAGDDALFRSGASFVSFRLLEVAFCPLASLPGR